MKKKNLVLLSSVVSASLILAGCGGGKVGGGVTNNNKVSPSTSETLSITGPTNSHLTSNANQTITLYAHLNGQYRQANSLNLKTQANEDYEITANCSPLHCSPSTFNLENGWSKSIQVSNPNNAVQPGTYPITISSSNTNLISNPFNITVDKSSLPIQKTQITVSPSITTLTPGESTYLTFSEKNIAKQQNLVVELKDPTQMGVLQFYNGSEAPIHGISLNSINNYTQTIKVTAPKTYSPNNSVTHTLTLSTSNTTDIVFPSIKIVVNPPISSTYTYSYSNFKVSSNGMPEIDFSVNNNTKETNSIQNSVNISFIYGNSVIGQYTGSAINVSKDYLLGYKFSIETSLPFSISNINVLKNANAGLKTPENNFYGLPTDVKVNGNEIAYTEGLNWGINTSTKIPTSSYQIGAYYADWSIYTAHQYSPSLVPIQNLNTLIYSFGTINPTQYSQTYTVGSSSHHITYPAGADIMDGWADVYDNKPNDSPPIHPGLIYFAAQRAAHPNLNVYYAFGGWGTAYMRNYTSGVFSALFDYYPQNIPQVAASMVSQMLKAGMNGIVLDYEWTAPVETYPLILGSKSPLCSTSSTTTCNPMSLLNENLKPSIYGNSIGKGYVELLTDIRNDMNLLTAKTGQSYKLGVALLSGAKYINALNEISGGSNYKNALQGIFSEANFVQLMTYDMHGTFDADNTNEGNITGFMSGVSSFPNSPFGSTGNFSITNSLQALKNDLGSSFITNLAKVSIGIPAYSRLEATTSTNKFSYINGVYQTLANSKYQAGGNYIPEGNNPEIVENPYYGEFVGDFLTQSKTGVNTDTYAKIPLKGLTHVFYNNGNHITQANIRGSATYDYKCIVDDICNNLYSSTLQPSVDNNIIAPADIFGKYNSTNKKYHLPPPISGLPSSQVCSTPECYAQTPWAYTTKVPEAFSVLGMTNYGVFMSFDDPTSVYYKMKNLVKSYIVNGKSYKLHGALLWEIDGDVPAVSTSDVNITKAQYKSQSLLYAMYNCLNNNVCTADS